jgi:hypothetical protein
MFYHLIIVDLTKLVQIESKNVTKICQTIIDLLVIDDYIGIYVIQDVTLTIVPISKLSRERFEHLKINIHNKVDAAISDSGAHYRDVGRRGQTSQMHTCYETAIRQIDSNCPFYDKKPMGNLMITIVTDYDISNSNKPIMQHNFHRYMYAKYYEMHQNMMIMCNICWIKNIQTAVTNNLTVCMFEFFQRYRVMSHNISNLVNTLYVSWQFQSQYHHLMYVYAANMIKELEETKKKLETKAEYSGFRPNANIRKTIPVSRIPQNIQTNAHIPDSLRLPQHNRPKPPRIHRDPQGSNQYITPPPIIRNVNPPPIIPNIPPQIQNIAHNEIRRPISKENMIKSGGSGHMRPIPIVKNEVFKPSVIEPQITKESKKKKRLLCFR